MEQAVTYHVDERNVALITLNRADKHNAFNDDMIATLTELFTRAGNDSSVRAVVLQGKGKSFSAGADLEWMKRMAQYDEAKNHINKHWKELNTWWNTENVQFARKIYLSNFFNVKADWHKEWSDYIYFSKQL